MAELRVGADDLDRIRSQLLHAQAELDLANARVDQLVHEFVSSWSGHAPQAVRPLIDQYHAGAERQAEAIRLLTDLIQNIAASYAQAEAANSALFGRLL